MMGQKGTNTGIASFLRNIEHQTCKCSKTPETRQLLLGANYIETEHWQFSAALLIGQISNLFLHSTKNFHQSPVGKLRTPTLE